MSRGRDPQRPPLEKPSPPPPQKRESLVIVNTGDGFSWLSDDLERSQALAAAAWELAEDTLAAGRHRLVVLDEITYPMTWGWISTDEVVAAIADRPAKVNVVCTGRDAPAPLVEVGDTVTEMRKVKHAYDTGGLAKKGIDY